MVPLGRKPPTASSAIPIKPQNVVKSPTPTLELDSTHDISRRVLHRASDKVIAYHAIPPTTPVSKQPTRPEVPSTPKPVRIVDKLTKVKESQPGDASATLMLPGVVDQTPKTPGCKEQVKFPAAPMKSSKISSRRVPAKEITRLKYTVVSTPVKSVSDRCAMRSTANTQVVVVVTPQKSAIKTPLAPTKTSKTSKFRPTEEIVRLEYCMVDVPPKSVRLRRLCDATHFD
jgi:hypothetical protein